MASANPLWVAPDPDEPSLDREPVTERPGSLSAAAGLGRYEQLVALRDRLATIIDSPTSLARDVASLSIRYMAVIREIAELDAVQTAKEGDELGNAAESPDETFDPTTI